MEGLGPVQISTMTQGLSPEQIVDRADRNDDIARAYVHDLQSLYQHCDSTKITSMIEHHALGDDAPIAHKKLWLGVIAIVETGGALFALELAGIVLEREEERRLGGLGGNEGTVASLNDNGTFSVMLMM
jgi:hypothetical protein